uniref:Uncharacterized protein n=1 Tax=Romanomermis culicivorax TaxID=13658 RepID=A0A915I9W5_ROMCU
MNDIPQNNIDIHPEQPPALMAGSTYDFRVRSKIPSTGWLSEPSDIVKYHLPDFSDQESTVLAAVGGSSVVFIISLLVIAILFAATRHKKVKRDERTPSFRRSTNGTANRSNHASREPHDEQLKSCSNNSNGYLLHHNNCRISDAPSKPDYEHSPSNSFLLIGQAPNGFMNDNRSEFDADQEKERNSFFPEFENTNLAMFPYSRESRVQSKPPLSLPNAA